MSSGPITNSSEDSVEAESSIDQRQRLAEAREQFEREPQNHYAASVLLQAMRKSREPATRFLRDARVIQQQFPTDAWVATHFGWLCYDACKESLGRNDLPGGVTALQNMIAVLPILNDNDGIYRKQAAWQFGRIVKLAKERPNTNKQFFVRLSSVGRDLMEAALPILSNERRRLSDGKTRMSQRDLFLEQLRSANERAEDWTFLRDLCLDVLTGHRPVADPTWFGKSLFEALGHVSAPATAEKLIESFLERHGRNPHVRIAQAGWLAKTGRITEAEAVYTMALAMSDDPWSWRRFALFLGHQERLADALQCLQAALVYRNPTEPGKVWKIHFEIGRLSLRLGDLAGAAAELQLARWARQFHGWQPDAKLERFISHHQEDLSHQLSEGIVTNGDDLLRQRVPLYRAARETFLLERAESGEVVRTDPNRGLAWIRLAQVEKQDALLRVGRNRAVPDMGLKVHTIAVPSWDKKRDRPGLAIVWWKAAR